MLPKCMHYDLNDQQKKKENRVNYAIFIEFSGQPKRGGGNKKSSIFVL